MRLKLDLAQHRLHKLLWLILTLVCLGIVVRQLPVNWVGGALASQTRCRVILQQPIGTIWQGSAALAFSEPNGAESGCREPVAVTERFHWATSCRLLSLGCNTEIQFAALGKSQVIQWGLGKTQFSANEIKLPANILEGLGNPWSTLRPRGELSARWTDLTLDGFRDVGSSRRSASGVIRIIISNLTSPISPVKPLGAYEIQANIGQEGINWNLSTTSGPLLLKGQGGLIGKSSGNRVDFSGEASASPEAQESLIGLLALLGKKEGDVYRLKF